jgi:hypothetical protein
MNKNVSNSLLVLAAVLSLPATVYADAAPGMQRLEYVRQMKQQDLDRRMGVLMQERGCVHAAMTMEALNACERISQQVMQSLQGPQKAGRENLQTDSRQDKESK